MSQPTLRRPGILICLLFLVAAVWAGIAWYTNSRPPQVAAKLTDGRTVSLRTVTFGAQQALPGQLRALSFLHDAGLISKSLLPNASHRSLDANPSLLFWFEWPIAGSSDYHLVLADFAGNEIRSSDLFGWITFRNQTTRGLGTQAWPRDGRPVRCRLYEDSGWNNPNQRLLAEFDVTSPTLPVVPPPGPISTNATCGELQVSLMDFVAQAQPLTNLALPRNHFQAQSFLKVHFSRHGQPWPDWRVSRCRLLDGAEQVLASRGLYWSWPLPAGSVRSLRNPELDFSPLPDGSCSLWMPPLWPNHTALRIQLDARQTRWDDLAADERWAIPSAELAKNQPCSIELQNHHLKFVGREFAPGFPTMVPCLVFECRPPAAEWELFPVWQFNAPPSNVIPTGNLMRERTEDGQRTTWELPLTSTNLPGDLYLGFQKLRRIEFTATARSLPKSAPTVPKP